MSKVEAFYKHLLNGGLQHASQPVWAVGIVLCRLLQFSAVVGPLGVSVAAWSFM